LLLIKKLLWFFLVKYTQGGFMKVDSDIDVNFFRSEGFQVFKNVVPLDVIDIVRCYLNEQIELTLDPAKKELKCSSNEDLVKIANELISSHRIEHLSKQTRDALTGHFSLKTRLSSKFLQVVFGIKFKSVLSCILNSQSLFMHMPPVARFILPNNLHSAVPPHQDVSYNQHMTNFITVWVPFVDIDENCGGVAVYRGSGCIEEMSVTKSSNSFWFKGIDTNDFEKVHCKISAGDILVMNKYIIHSSMPNISNRTRISTDFRFFGSEDQSSKHYLDLDRNIVVDPNGLG